MNHQHWIICNSVRSLMAGLLLALASGCGSTPAGSSDASPPEVMTEVPQSAETNSLGETLCSQRDLGADEDGMHVVEREIYNFPKLNEELAQFPELAEATGFRAITDCEGARKYGEAYRAFAAQHPDFRQETSKADEFDEMLSDPANIGQLDPAGPEVEKVFGGSIGDRPAVVQFARKIGDNLYDFCSAVRIAGPIFTTAAHCLPNPTSGKMQAYQVYLKRRKSNGVEGWLGGTRGKWFNIYAMPHPKYAGLTSGDFDAAVVYVLKQNQPLLNSEPEFSATTLIATRNPTVSDGQLIYGWGAENNAERGLFWRLRTPPPQGTLHGIDGVTGEAWQIQDTGPTMRMCKGDSGGAALRDGMLDGITSVVLPLPSAGSICSETGKYQFWSRIDTKFTWLRESIATMQGATTKTPFKCVFHSGNPSDPKDYEHILSYMNCNEH
ncbi:MAG TPA: trypsin-like serine protease [Polyangiaceae bacterium]|nr:trypsin-like serine protease [Polyangiaceae bacterium]